MPGFDEFLVKINVKLYEFWIIFFLVTIVPVGFMMRFISSVRLRLFYAGFFGLFYNLVMYRDGTGHLLVMFIMSYLLTRLELGQRHLVLTAYSFFHLLGYQIYRAVMLGDSYYMDVSGPMMMFFLRNTALAYNLYDGTYNPEPIKEHAALMIKAPPSFLELFGFHFYFGTGVLGPFAEYTLFINWIKTPPGKEYSRSEGVLRGLYIFGCALVCIGAHQLLKDPFSRVYMSTTEFTTKNIFARYWHAWFAYAVEVTRYTFVFHCEEASNVLSGLAFSGRDPKTDKAQWEGIPSIRVLTVLASQSPFQFLTNWNMTVQQWMKNYVYFRYLRYGEKKSRDIATFLTFFSTALWHGIFPGYFMGFAWAMALTFAGRIFRRKIRPFFMREEDDAPIQPWKYFYDAAGFLFSSLIACPFVGTSQILLSWGKVYRFWKHLWFFPHIIVALVIFVDQIGGFKRFWGMLGRYDEYKRRVVLRQSRKTK